MAKNFSVFVNIGGKLNPSLSGAVQQAKALVGGLNGRLAALHTATRSTFDGVGHGLSKAGRGLQDTGARTSAAISAPVGLIGGAMARQAFAFEKAGNMLEALGDATAEQRAEFEKFANDLNKKYPQTLTEIINTGNEMLKGGFNFEQMKGAIDQTIATAVLGEMTPSEVGNMMARTINSFQLPMKTYQEAMRSSQRVSDQMTFAAVKTTASLKDMGEMYRYVGGASSAAGIPLEQASAFAMAFAKNGSVGSDAGVAMRSAIIRMIKPVKPQLAAMDRIGLKRSDYVGGREITPESIISGLQADGIDASSLKKDIGRLVKNKDFGKDPTKLAAEITKIVQAKLGREGSAVDAATISSSVQDAVTASGSKVDLMKFFVDFKKKVDEGKATAGDLASLFEGRHFSRYMALFQSDLPALLKQINEESNGYTQARYGTVLKGIVGPVYEVDAALEKLSVTLGRLAFPTAAKGLTVLADSLTKLSEANPALLTAGLYAAGAAVAFGPLALAVGASMRALGLFVRVVGLVGAASTVGLATKLTGLAASMWAVSAAASAGAIARLRAFAVGAMALGTVGGGSAVLAALGGSILALGRAVLLFPVVALRGIGVAMWGLVANPVGITITGIVAALTALGLWVSNNWGGIKEFFGAFGDAFSKGLGPEASANVDAVVTSIKSAWEWVSKLLGPIDETGAKWRSWGEWAGQGAASVVTALTGLPAQIGELAKKGYEALTSFDWGKAGKTIVDAIVAGLASAGGALVDAVRGLAGRAVSGVAGALGLGGGSAAPGGAPAAAGAATGGGAPAIAGARALGGPVTGGLPYLVGERGPEIFVPETSGRIETNGALRSLAKAGGQAPGGLAVTVDASSITEAGKAAKVAGGTIRDSLDTTVKPVVDMTSIDAALAKVAGLKAAIGGLDGEGGGSGGGSGGGGSAGGDGGALRAALSAGASTPSPAASAAGGMASGRTAAGAAAAVRTAALSNPAAVAGASVAGTSAAGGAPAAGGYTGNDGRRASRSGMSATGRDNVASWMSFFQKPVDQGGMGVDADKAKGLVAMMQGESGLNLDPTAKGDHNRAGVPQSFGTAQWNRAAGRFGALERHAATMGLPWTDRGAQQSFFRKEMLEGNYRGAWARIQAAKGGEGALAAGIVHYENPKHHSLAYQIRKPFLDRLRRDGSAPAAAEAAVAGAPAAKAGARMMPGAERVNPGYGKPLHKGGTGLSRYSDEDLRRMTAADAAGRAPSVAAAAKPADAPKNAGATSTPAAKAASTPTVAVAGARANGGPVTGGLPYLVGERGPEIFVPQATGRIATNGALKALSDETPAGLAPGQAPADPRRDGSAQPTAAGRRLSSTLAAMAGNALRGALDLARLPGDVYAGRVDPKSDEGIQRAVSLAGNLAGGGIGFAQKGAAGIFGGRLAAGADLNALKQAEALAAAGAARKDIWDKTGWFQGSDKKWRFEINDSAARYTPESAGKLGEALAHPALSRAYPGVAETAFRQADLLSRGAKGAFSPRRGVAVDRTLDAAAGRSTALHEAQHAVQVAEGFAGGANPNAITQGAYADWLLGRYVRGRAPAADDVAVGAFDRWRLARYRQSAGEVEARNVQRRRDMTPEERRAAPPWTTQDVADKYHVVDAAPSAVKLAGARALGGPVTGGRSYLVGERGPEIFTPGAGGAISTNDTLNGLTAAGQALGPIAGRALGSLGGFLGLSGGMAGGIGQILGQAGGALGPLSQVLGRAGAIRSGEGPGRLAPRPEDVAKAMQSHSTTIHHGDKTVSVRVDGSGMDPQAIGREAERAVMRVLGRFESDQRGYLSD